MCINFIVEMETTTPSSLHQDLAMRFLFTQQQERLCRHKDEFVSHIENLFESVTNSNDAPICLQRSIAAYIKDVCLHNPNVIRVLIRNISSIPNPLPYIEILPAIVCVSSNELIQETIETLIAISHIDGNFLLPTLGVIADLPIPQHLLSLIVPVAESALSQVDEADMPALFRMLLGSFVNINSDYIVTRIRREVF